MGELPEKENNKLKKEVAHALRQRGGKSELRMFASLAGNLNIALTEIWSRIFL